MLLKSEIPFLSCCENVDLDLTETKTVNEKFVH